MGIMNYRQREGHAIMMGLWTPPQVPQDEDPTLLSVPFQPRKPFKPARIPYARYKWVSKIQVGVKDPRWGRSRSWVSKERGEYILREPGQYEFCDHEGKRHDEILTDEGELIVIEDDL